MHACMVISRSSILHTKDRARGRERERERFPRNLGDVMGISLPKDNFHVNHAQGLVALVALVALIGAVSCCMMWFGAIWCTELGVLFPFLLSA